MNMKKIALLATSLCLGVTSLALADPAAKKAVIAFPRSPDTVAAASAVASPTLDLERMIARGDALLATADVVSARLFYELAASRGSTAAAARLGNTYDPFFLAEARLHGVRADPAKAAEWYGQAIAAGDPDTATRLHRLKPQAVTSPATSPAAAASTPVAPPPERMIARGDALLGTADVVSARLFYELAASRGSAAAAARLGQTYDPVFLAEAQLRGVRADSAKAAHWYGQAIAAGDPGAAARLQSLAAVQTPPLGHRTPDSVVETAAGDAAGDGPAITAEEVNLTLALPADLVAAIDRECLRLGLSRPGWIRMVLAEQVDRAGW